MNGSWVCELLTLQVDPARRVDRARGVVPNVRVCGPSSPSWGRRYPVGVLTEAVAKFAAVVNIGHHFDYVAGQPIPVPPDKVFGKIEGPRISGDGVNGDLRYNQGHGFASPFLWACESDPTTYSFSPLMRVQFAKQKDKDGMLVAERIVEVLSVDVVDLGGTTSSVFESWNRSVGTDIPTAAESPHSRKLREMVTELTAGTRTPLPAHTPRLTPESIVTGFDPDDFRYRRT